MTRKILFALIILIGCPASIYAQAPNAPRPIPAPMRFLSDLPPVVRSMLATQAKRPSGKAAKPAEAERLVASVEVGQMSSDLYYDSILYIRSGGSGGVLLEDQLYISWYFPLNMSVNTDFYEHPNILYDTAIAYYRPGTQPLYYGGEFVYSYNASDQVTEWRSKLLASTGVPLPEQYGAITYNASGQFDHAVTYRDTSANGSGMFQPVESRGAGYTGNERTSDTQSSLSSINLYRNLDRYTYNALGQMATRRYMISSDLGVAFQDFAKDSFQYDASGRIQCRYTAFAQIGGGWDESSMDTFGYTGSSALYTFAERRSYSGPDIFVTRVINSLNAAGNWDSTWTYNNDSGALALTGAYQYTYNANNHVTAYQGMELEAIISTWVPYAQRYYYGPDAGISGTGARPASGFAAIYPNPASNQATLLLTDPKGNIQLSITNLAGQMLYEQHSPATNTMDISTASLPAGLYQLTLRMGDAVQTLKLVKE